VCGGVKAQREIERGGEELRKPFFCLKGQRNSAIIGRQNAIFEGGAWLVICCLCVVFCCVVFVLPLPYLICLGLVCLDVFWGDERRRRRRRGEVWGVTAPGRKRNRRKRWRMGKDTH
jgi:hypothetical protein